MNSTENGTWRTSAYSNGTNCIEAGGWRKASFSESGNCTEIGAWRKSARSQGASNCVEAGDGDAVVGVRDTKQAHLGEDRTVLEFSPAAWAGFLARVRGQ